MDRQRPHADPRLAGWAGMPYRTFVTASLPTACAWAATLVILSYHLAPEVIQQITTHLTVAGPVLVVAWLLVVWAVRARLKARTGTRQTIG
ncbi:hypothetical protein ACFQX6_31465 [Streptosporangium lutulentum]